VMNIKQCAELCTSQLFGLNNSKCQCNTSGLQTQVDDSKCLTTGTKLGASG